MRSLMEACTHAQLPSCPLTPFLTHSLPLITFNPPEIRGEKATVDEYFEE